MRILYHPKKLTRITWANVHWGLLYNWYVVEDARNIAPAGWHVPTEAEWDTFTTWLIDNGYGYGGSGDDIAKSMAHNSDWEPSATAGTPGNDQATNNSSGFNCYQVGQRRSADFSAFGALFWTQTGGSWYGVGRYIAHSISTVTSYAIFKRWGFNVRLIKDDDTDVSTMVDNNGFTYLCEKYGNQVWMVENLKSTKYRNGDIIPEVTDQTEWDALITGGLCAMNNDWSNV
jgi:uncharacterized protein (TIGR02145 family)